MTTAKKKTGDGVSKALRAFGLAYPGIARLSSVDARPPGAAASHRPVPSTPRSISSRPFRIVTRAMPVAAERPHHPRSR